MSQIKDSGIIQQKMKLEDLVHKTKLALVFDNRRATKVINTVDKLYKHFTLPDTHNAFI